MVTPSIHVLVVDDYEPWRRFVTASLQKDPRFQLIGEGSDGPHAVQQAQQMQPDLVVLDIGLPTLNGIEAARQIRLLSPNSTILFLSENLSLDIVEEAMRTGASGYVLKSDAASALSPAVEAVLQGQRFLSASLNDYDRTARDEITNKIVGLQRPHKGRARNGHPVDFYREDSVFVAALANYVETALTNGKVAVVIASESHRAIIRQRLRSSGVDIDAVVQRNCYIPLDLADSLSTDEGAPHRNSLATDADYRTLEAIRAAQARHLHVAIG